MPNHRCRRKRFHLHEGTLKPDSEEALLGVFLQGRWQLGPASSQESHSRRIFFGVDFNFSRPGGLIMAKGQLRSTKEKKKPKAEWNKKKKGGPTPSPHAMGQNQTKTGLFGKIG